MVASYLIGVVFSTSIIQNEMKCADIERLQGEWIATNILRSGRQLPKAFLTKAGLLVKGNKCRFGTTFIEKPFSDFKIDSSKLPCRIDLVTVEPFGKVVLRGLYKLEGDELVFYFSNTPSERPTGINDGEFRDKWIFQRKRDK